MDLCLLMMSVIFILNRKYIKQLVMALADKFITDTEIKHDIVSNKLTTEELDFLLHYLRNADLKGYQVEMFYNLVIKLQNQYIEHSNKGYNGNQSS